MDTPILEIEQGKLRGRTSFNYKGGRYYSFQGIPYAKQPVAELRFKPPQSPDPWTGIRDCTREASESLGIHMIFQFETGSEYCLYLNVYTPELPKEQSQNNLKPVMFWIHGGGFVAGSSKTDVYGPEYFMTEDVVLVTINYRLGALGFLSLEDPSLNVPGNLGIKDCLQALQWVQKNIHQFNGDAGNVTIFGNSAGSAICHILMLSPLTDGLIHRVILQSGCALNPWIKGAYAAETLARALGLECTKEKDVLDKLMSVPGEELLETQISIPVTIDVSKDRPWGFMVEKASNHAGVLTVEPLDILISGDYKKVPLLIGYNNKEGMFSEVLERLQTGGFKLFTDFESKIPKYFQIPRGSDLSKRIAQKIKKFYFNNNNPMMDNLDSFYNLESDLMFIRGTYKTIQYNLKHSNYPTYVYRFSTDMALNFNKKFGNIESPGACHLDEVGYLFKTTFMPNFKEDSKEDIQVQKIIKLWTNFAKTGNPNPVNNDPLIDVIWKPAKDKEIHFLDIGEKLTLGTNPDKERMQFWDEISEMCPAAKNM